MKLSSFPTSTKIGLAAGTLFVVFVAFRIVTNARSFGGDSEDMSALPPPSSLQATRPAPRSVVVPESKEIDLLDLVDTTRDAIAGTWGFQDRSLVTPAIYWGRLEVPCIAPEEYDLKLVVTRKQGINSFNVGVVAGGHQGMIVVDGEEEGKQTSLHLAGSTPHWNNETTRVGKFLKWNRPTPLTISVRKESIALSISDKPVFERKGSPAALLLLPAYRVPHEKVLFFGSWESAFRIESAKLFPISGKPAPVPDKRLQ
jgi:hypothetical protein